MTLPEALHDAVGWTLNDRALDTVILRWDPIGGGCIHNGLRLSTIDAPYFLKWNADIPEEMFAREAESLDALRASSSIRVPDVIGHGAFEGGRFLLLEYIEPVAPERDSDERLGMGLAQLHEAGEGDFGWPSDNWIGSLPQANTPMDDWGAFWRDRRIAPQLELCRDRGYCSEKIFDRLLVVIPSGLSDVVSPDLVHGDLWGGNTFTTTGGEPVIIDPAVYRGHGEVDLAMSELFGGFGPGFQRGYSTLRPITPEYTAYRRDLYQLYYLLVHVNLFGAAYVSGSLAAASRVVSTLS